jgi:hypothetical protein
VLGLSAAAARDLRRLGDATAGGAIQFQTATFDALVAQLEREARFDRATAHWIAMRSLAEPDAVLGGLNGPAAVSERWRPWRSYVALCQATAARAAAESAPRAPLSRPRAAR